MYSFLDVVNRSTTVSPSPIHTLYVIIEQTSAVAASIDRVWARIVTPAGINDEMRPWMTMSPPRGVNLTIDTLPVGVPIGRCWLKLFGIIPFDYDLLMIAEIRPGRSFYEKSTMLSMHRWEHERTLTPRAAATLVQDRITFDSRVPGLATAVAPFLRAFFAHRHRRLARHFAE